MFWERLNVLCKERGIKPNNVAQAIGASTATATKWKKGAVPNGETLENIADYFECSIDYLMGRTNYRSVALGSEVNYIRLYDSSVSAGTGLDIDYTTSEEIEVNEDTEGADFAVRVSGDSMEPRFYSGDIVLVESTPSVEVGEIGIFILNGQAFIKELGRGELISLNSRYDPLRIKEDDSIYCQGRVIKVLNMKKGA